MKEVCHALLFISFEVMLSFSIKINDLYNTVKRSPKLQHTNPYKASSYWEALSAANNNPKKRIETKANMKIFFGNTSTTNPCA